MTQMIEEYEFRKARETDNLVELVHLIYHADPYLYKDLFGSEDNAVEVLGLLLNKKNFVFSRDNYHVVLVDGKIVGLAALYTNYPPWDENRILDAFYRKHLTIPESFYDASDYFDKVFNYPKVGINTCNVVVHEDYRGLGIGDILIKKIIQISGYSPLELVVIKDNIAAIRLYQKNGFVAVDEFLDYGGHNAPPIKCLRMFLNKQ